MKSGIYAAFGSERKDLITEATAQEFKDWMAVLGFNISFMSDDTLNGNFMGRQQAFSQWEIRCAFIADVKAKGVTVNRDEGEWEAFTKVYEKKANRHYG